MQTLQMFFGWDCIYKLRYTVCIPLLGLCLQKDYFNHIHIRDPVVHFRNSGLYL